MSFGHHLMTLVRLLAQCNSKVYTSISPSPVFTESQKPFSKACYCTEIAQTASGWTLKVELQKKIIMKDITFTFYDALLGPEDRCGQGMPLMLCGQGTERSAREAVGLMKVQGLFRDSHDMPKSLNNSPSCCHQPLKLSASPQMAVEGLTVPCPYLSVEIRDWSQ